MFRCRGPNELDRPHHRVWRRHTQQFSATITELVSNRSITGLLESEDEYIHARHYSAVISFHDGLVALLTQNDLVRLSEMPNDTEDLPSQFIDCRKDVTGGVITNAFRLHRPGARVSGANGPQLFLVLDSELMMGIVPTQRGRLLHVEPIMSYPLFRLESTLTTLEGLPT